MSGADADLALGVTVTRTLLGEPPLDVNDFDRYYVTRTFLGGGVTWERTKAGSPWLDGDVTVARRRAQTMEPITIEVLGDTPGELQANHDLLVAAFNQDTFRLDITVGADAHYAYKCEASDYKMSWVPERFIAGQIQIEFQVPRHPVPYVGVV